MVARWRDARLTLVALLLAIALGVALVRPASASAAADAPRLNLGKINALFGPNQRNLEFFDVDAFHGLSATDVFNNVTFETSFPALAFNPPAGVGPRCSNATHVDEQTRPMTAVARQPDGTCQAIPAEGTAVNGQRLQAGVDQLQAFIAQFVTTVDVDSPGVASFTVRSSGAWFIGFSPPPLATGTNPPVEFVSGPNIEVPRTTGGGFPALAGRNTITQFAAAPLRVRFPVAGTYTMEVDFAAQAATPPSFVLETESTEASATKKLSLAESVRSPSDISNSVTHVATNAAVAAGLGFVVAFPSELFDSTFAEHYEEITGWFRRQRDRFRRRRHDGARTAAVARLPSVAAFGLVLVVSAVLYGLLDPSFGFDRDSAVLFAGLVLALVASTLVFSLPAFLAMRTRHGEWGRLTAFPGALPIAAACVLLSRVAHFQPGYLYGAIAGIGFATELSVAEEGQTVALTIVWTLMASIVAWLLRSPIHTSAAKAGSGFVVQAIDAALASIVVIGLEGAVIGLLPLQFLDGARVKRWNRRIWLALFAVSLFAFVHILLNPTSGYVASTSRGAVVTTAVVFVGFGLGSLAFWAFFRFRFSRPRPSEPAPF